MVKVAAPVKNDPGNPLSQRPLGNQFADTAGSLNVLADTIAGPEFRSQGRSGSHRPSLHVVNNLGVDVIEAPVYTQPGPIRGAKHLFPDPDVFALANFLSRLLFRHSSHTSSLTAQVFTIQ
jgi:hypothetical protein